MTPCDADTVLTPLVRLDALCQIVREHYLRDDLSCGVRECEKCEQLQTLQKRGPLTRTIESPSTAVPEPHVVIPDTNVILHQVRH